MDHPKRGVAVIFNQKHFSIPSCSTREGTDKDRDNLEILFKKLEFDVLVHDDLTIAEIRSVLILGRYNLCNGIVEYTHWYNRFSFKDGS